MGVLQLQVGDDLVVGAGIEGDLRRAVLERGVTYKASVRQLCVAGGEVVVGLRVADREASRRESFDRDVVHLACGAAAEQDTEVGLGAVGVADQRDVRENRVGVGQREEVVRIVVSFNAVVSSTGLLLHNGELDVADPAEVPIQAVIARGRNDDVLGVDGAAPELHPVVEVLVYLDVVNLRAAADAVQRHAVDLVVGRDLRSAELDAYVLDDAAAVGVVVTTVHAGAALSFRLAGRRAIGAGVDDAQAVEHHAAPRTARAGSVEQVSGEDDGLGRGAFGGDGAVAGDDQETVGRGFAVDGGARLDQQVGGVGVVTNGHGGAQQPRLVGGEVHVFGVGAGQDAGAVLLDAGGGLAVWAGVGVGIGIGVGVGVVDHQIKINWHCFDRYLQLSRIGRFIRCR